MKIAISSLGPDLESQVDSRFGRAKYFIIVDPETKGYKAIPNESADSMHGAGVQASQLISNKNVSAIITGQVGPNAHQTLKAAGVKIYHADSITVSQAIDAFNKGELPQITESGPAHGGKI